MVPIRVKFDGRYQTFQLVESYTGLDLEDGEAYCLVPDSPRSEIFDDDIRDVFERGYAV
jgi:hypothetical protein